MKYEDFKAVCKWLQTEQVSLDLNEDEIKQEYSLFKAENKAINYSQCCTELICDFDNINDGSLTKGKKYVKIHEHNGMVVIVNDFDEVMSYNKEAFFEAI